VLTTLRAFRFVTSSLVFIAFFEEPEAVERAGAEQAHFGVDEEFCRLSAMSRLRMCNWPMRSSGVNAPSPFPC